MNKTEKFIVAFLLAFTALAGALHFLLPVKPLVSAEKNETVKSPANTTDKVVSNASVPTPVAFTSVPSGSSLEQFRQWARKDPVAAWDWILKQPDDARRVEMLEEFCFQIAENGDPGRAVTLADELHLTDHGTLANLEQQWAQKDLPAAREWAIAKPDSDGKNELLERVAYVWATADPGNAAQFVVETMSPGNAQTEAAICVLHQWALRDFSGASAWVEQFPDGLIRDRAMNELAGIQEYSLPSDSSKSSQSKPSRTQ